MADPRDRISDRLQSLQTLSRLTRQVADAARPVQIYEAALDALRDAIGAERASILLFDAAGIMRFRAWRGLSADYRAAVEGHSPWPKGTRDARPVVIEDVEQAPELASLLPVFRAEGIRALSFIPLAAQHELIGKFMVYRGEPHHLSPTELELILAVAERVALGLERLRTAEELRASHDQLEAILAGIVDGVTAQDARGRIVFANPAAARMLGFASVDELIATPVEDIVRQFEMFDADGSPLPLSELPSRHALAGRTAPQRLIAFRSASGSEIRWSMVSSAPVFSDEGDVRLVINIFRDVSQARREQERIRFLSTAGETLARSLDFETTLKSVARLSIPLLADWCRIDLLEPDGSVRLLAVEHRDPAKIEWARQIRQRFQQNRDPDAVRRVIDSGRSELYAEISDEVLVASAKGDPDYLDALRQGGFRSAMIVPLTAHGHTLGALSLIAAESRVRYTEDDLRFAEDLARRAALAIDNARLFMNEQDARRREEQARAEAEAASRAKDDFLAIISHELRTPLTAILGWSRMLTSMALDPDLVKTGLHSILNSAEAQARLIEDLLDASRIVTGKLQIHPEPVTLIDPVRSAIATLETAIAAKRIDLQVVADPSIRVFADADRMQQVIWNLLSNAVKFTAAGGKVEIHVQRADGQAKISVRDSGEGIDPELLPVMFDRFRQADSSTTRTHGGLGLGLAIVKAIVEMHGGEVRAESSGRGHGALFEVVMPVHAAEAASVEPVSRPRTRLDGRRILLVEDHRETRTFLNELLRSAGAEVRDADSVDAAMEMIDGWQPDVVLSDIAMPRQDGYALLQQLRSRRADIPAIAMTAFGRPGDEDRATTAGFRAYLRKPFDPDALMHCIDGVLA